MISDLSVNELLSQFKQAVELDDEQGAELFFKELYGRYKQRFLLSAVSRRLTAQEAEDVSQETFLRIFKSIKSYRIEENGAGWLSTICENVINTLQGKKSREQEHLSSFDTISEDDTLLKNIYSAQRSVDPAQEAINKERIEAVGKALKSISATDREAIRKVLEKPRTVGKTSKEAQERLRSVFKAFYEDSQ